MKMLLCIVEPGWRRRSFFVAACAQLDVVAVDDDIVVHDGIDHRVVAVDRAVRDTVHDDERAAEAVTGHSPDR